MLSDCDGVLVDSEASLHAAWSRWACDLDLEPDAVNSLVHGRRAQDVVALLVLEAQRAEQLARIDRYELESAATVRAVPGAPALLESLSGERWAVVTSGRAELARPVCGPCRVAVPAYPRRR